MNPLIGIAAGVVPDIIKLIAGDSTGQLAEQVGKAVADTVGTTNASDAQTKLAANPAAQNALRQKLAELALDATKAQNADAGQRAQEALANTQSARSGLQALATTNSTIAWTAPTISYLVIGGFFIFLFVLVSLYWGKPADNQNNFIVQIINIAVGALTAAFATVVNFWLGSSAGSQKKDDANLTLQQAQAERANANIKSLQDKITPRPQAAQAPVQAAAYRQAPAPAKPSDQQGSSRFDACMPFIFKAEGGYSDNPVDPGGPTNFGITLATLRADPNLTAEDVKKLARAVAREIYRTAYWNRMQCGALPPGLDLEVFDFGVNSGPAESVKTLQGLVGVTQDGSVGPITLAAVRQFNVGDLIGVLPKRGWHSTRASICRSSNRVGRRGLLKSRPQLRRCSKRPKSRRHRDDDCLRHERKAICCWMEAARRGRLGRQFVSGADDVSGLGSARSVR
jgi:lysozyme family protein